ncbi:hypothetical protein B0A50_07414 [Salinomyces thailandicus]|uniref:Uncharacterized protein n=1 Tax=Salinomyces thailandicus TaxID=706561 RepID=A0A4U0TMJ1_9PEZI|nr:hypothetical protein B0A50_07414 [Salinomyces thailandica]
MLKDRDQAENQSAAYVIAHWTRRERPAKRTIVDHNSDDDDDSDEAIQSGISTDACSNILGQSKTGDGDAAQPEGTLEALNDSLTALLDTEDELSRHKILTADVAHSIGYLSTVNPVSSSVALADAPNLETGNRRDTPSQFLICVQRSGCERTSLIEIRRDQHSVNCEVELLQKPERILVGEDELAQTLHKPRKRKRHKPKFNAEFPKQCPDINNCDVKKAFASKARLAAHRQLHHEGNGYLASLGRKQAY